MNNESDMQVTLKRVSRIFFFGILLFSMYLSYDGFDQKVTGGNNGYSLIANIIGVGLAVGISALQFILNSRYEELNPTLKFLGFASYIYSIYTNYLGAVHLMGMSDFMAWATALGMDVAPEPVIAWTYGDALKGDLIGNAWKLITGTSKKPTQAYQSQSRASQEIQSRPVHVQGRPSQFPHGKGGQGRPMIPGRPQNAQVQSSFTLEDILKKGGMTKEQAKNRFPDRQRFKSWASQKFEISGQNMNEIYDNLVK